MDSYDGYNYNSEEDGKGSEGNQEKYEEYLSSGIHYLDIGSKEHRISDIEKAMFHFGQAKMYASNEYDRNTCEEYIKDCSDCIDYIKSDECESLL